MTTKIPFTLSMHGDRAATVIQETLTISRALRAAEEQISRAELFNGRNQPDLEAAQAVRREFVERLRDIEISFHDLAMSLRGQ